MTNHSVVMEFYLMEFSNTRELRVLHAFVFLIIYLETIMGNLLIMILVTLDQSLHTPMYFFLQNLSFLDSCLISITVPKFILNSLSQRSTISLSGCVLQIMLVVHFASSELFLLSVMSYDRYVAICHPLHYENIMNRGFCVQMAAASWLAGSIFGVLYSAGTFSLSFCGSRKLPHFFCDVPSLLKISCSKTHIIINVSVSIGVLYALLCLVCIVYSYICIFNIVLRMPSFQGRSKAFSTCLPHLVVVITFFMTGAVAYLKPVPDSPDLLDFVMSAFYCVVPPSLNPIIYSLRNKEIKVALCKILWKLSHYKNSK
ncbi:PREDICTED: olfactory receptor 14K1-like [Chrysochloris asiatica]|uniref:Olfactory receptor n=1 Tax=Chrysochloris asiatica TaxID=185453 RepID=A0A9B0U7X2_CHRAS|nr:PREDICTED: olfactory receptor 14K1-like [Chrysochloris asiatica]